MPFEEMTIEDFVYEDLLWGYDEARANGAVITVPDEAALARGGGFSGVQAAFLRGDWKPDLKPTDVPKGFDPAAIQRMVQRAAQQQQSKGADGSA